MMIPLAKLENHINHLSQDKVDIILEIRNIVADLCPEAVERLDAKGITYYDAQRGGPVKAGICQIMFEDDHLHLAFIHGAFLPDPSHLLQANAQYKKIVKLDTFNNVPWNAVTALITASAHFDPTDLPQNQK